MQLRAENDWYHGADGYDRALAEHTALHKPMLVYFYTDWCLYCRSLDGVFQSKNFRTRYASMVKVKINPETGWREHALADRFHIELRNAVKEQPDVVAFDYLAWIALDKEDWSVAPRRHVRSIARRRSGLFDGRQRRVRDQSTAAVRSAEGVVLKCWVHNLRS